MTVVCITWLAESARSFACNSMVDPALAINDLTIVEGNAGTSVATFNVGLSPASSQTVTVNFATANNTASAGTDFVATSGTLTFAPGQTSRPITVTINGDTTFEPNETFLTSIFPAPRTRRSATTQGVATITNDDATAIIHQQRDVTEGNSGTTMRDFHGFALEYEQSNNYR